MTFTGSNPTHSTECSAYSATSAEKGEFEGGMSMIFVGDQKTFQMEVYGGAECKGEKMAMQATEAESAKILAGECGTITLSWEDGKTETQSMKYKHKSGGSGGSGHDHGDDDTTAAADVASSSTIKMSMVVGMLIAVSLVAR
eukprot:gnl/TRDRNA2_/TRDRNA2_94610_c0_seq1.p1 gnl/TRDRNA2_/TRDRNA2_94610_c0~~gnl/TRDRNA2_/TRDRNA2_94610_c0_seq1.p1  ORF type:complete len:142 (+),score=21.28 gnl/TRDRNA2_/TRDRNA2_94610_c0_seq1:26-451(+)